MKSCNVSDATLTKLAREVLMVDDNNQSLIPNYLNVMANGLPQPAPVSVNFHEFGHTPLIMKHAVSGFDCAISTIWR